MLLVASWQLKVEEHKLNKLQSTKIFDSPLEEKQKCTIQTNNRGWSGMHSETLDPKNQRV